MTAAITTPARPWPRRCVVLVVLVTLTSVVQDVYLLPALVVAAALLVRGVGWPTVASCVLPAAERANWRAELAAVLHAAPDRRERRRQLRGFVLALPACVASSWYLTFASRR